jgi:hypothetical protein
MKHLFCSKFSNSMFSVILTSFLLLWTSFVQWSTAFEQPEDPSVAVTAQAQVDLEDTDTTTGADSSKKWYDYYKASSDVTKANRVVNWIILDNVADAIEYLYNSGMTRFSSPSEFMNDKWLRRDEAAAFFVRFARDVLGMDHNDPDSDGDWIDDLVAERCLFSDLDQAHSDLKEEIQESCRLGLFKGHQWTFMPTDEFSNAHAMTVMIRLIEWMQEEPEDNWAREYFIRARRAWLVQSLEAEQEENLYRPITRGDVAKMIEWSAVYIASKENERCTIDPIDQDDDDDGILTGYERCIIEWQLMRAQWDDYNSSRSNKSRAENSLCETWSGDCDDTDEEVFPWEEQINDADSEHQQWFESQENISASTWSIWHRIDKASPYIYMTAWMPCDWVTCPDWSCAATNDECVWIIDDTNLVFVTMQGDSLYCRESNGEGEDCPRERNQTWGIEILTEREFTQDYKKYLTYILTQRLQLSWISNASYSFSEWRVVWIDWLVDLVVLVEPSEVSLAQQTNSEVDSDDIELAPACVTSSWQGECPENKTCSDGTTVDCTCNTGICLCKMCSESSTLEIK